MPLSIHASIVDAVMTTMPLPIHASIVGAMMMTATEEQGRPTLLSTLFRL
jgi:hypothetical protein